MGKPPSLWFRNCALWSQALQSICGSTSGKKDAESHMSGFFVRVDGSGRMRFLLVSHRTLAHFCLDFKGSQCCRMNARMVEK